MIVTGPEPEWEMVRRVLPYSVPSVGLALALGAAVGGWGVGSSAAIGVAVVVLNHVAHGLSLAWAARISATMVFAVGLGGFVARLATILLVLILLNRLQWFSAAAFAAAVVPATILLLVYEAGLLSGKMQANLWRITSAKDPHP
jgi:hypothetical protein